MARSIRPSAQLPANYAFLRNHDAGVIDVPFYYASNCTTPESWSVSLVDFCFQDRGNKDVCDTLVDPSDRVKCYCGALGGSTHQCENGERSSAVLLGQALLEKCLREESVAVSYQGR